MASRLAANLLLWAAREQRVRTNRAAIQGCDILAPQQNQAFAGPIATYLGVGLTFATFFTEAGYCSAAKIASRTGL
jgi:hypothetical protein